MRKKIIIAIDGPAGSGKSTTAKLVAKRLDISYIDSGAIYRAYTLETIRQGVQPDDEKAISQLLEQTRVEIENSADGSLIFLNQQDATDEIRQHEVTAKVSSVSEQPRVREAVNRALRQIAANRSVVVDGRDIGTVVFPHANLKIYLDASIEERAKRRYKELKGSKEALDFEKIKSDIVRRDRQDKGRKVAPLSKADDAIILDTTNLSIDEGVDFVVHKAVELL